MRLNGIELGPSVHEAAELLIQKNRKKIQDLQDEIAAAQVRLRTGNYANVLESERLAMNDGSPSFFDHLRGSMTGEGAYRPLASRRPS